METILEVLTVVNIRQIAQQGKLNETKRHQNLRIKARDSHPRSR